MCIKPRRDHISRQMFNTAIAAIMELDEQTSAKSPAQEGCEYTASVAPRRRGVNLSTARRYPQQELGRWKAISMQRAVPSPTSSNTVGKHHAVCCRAG